MVLPRPSQRWPESDCALKVALLSGRLEHKSPQECRNPRWVPPRCADTPAEVHTKNSGYARKSTPSDAFCFSN